jgi:MOSC domain-containing protein YiiM
MIGTLLQLNVSQGGMPKLPVATARVTPQGVEGDRQRNKKCHGGPNRAICIFSTELYDRLRALGIDLVPGSVGENLTTTGIDLQRLARGDRLKVGQCVIEITSVRVPCRNLKQWDEDLPELIVGYSGWVANVITEAAVRAGDSIEQIQPPVRQS